MSYRNPQIIVDRSAEIWASNVGTIGNIFANTIDTYLAAKNKANAENKKQIDAYQILTNETDLYNAELAKKASKDLPSSVIKKWQEGVNAYSGPATKAQVELKLNPNLTPEQRKKYKEDVLNYTDYLERSPQFIGMIQDKINVGVGKDDSELPFGVTYKYSGDTTKEQYSNWLIPKVLNNQKIPGVTTETDLISNDYQDELSVKFTIKSDTFNKLVNDKLLNKDDFKLTKDGDAIGEWTRNVKEFAESTEEFKTRVDRQGDRNKALIEANYIDPKTGNLTGKGVFPNMYVRNEKQGNNNIQYKENHINTDEIEKDPAYTLIQDSIATGIMALSPDEQVAYVQNNFGWGNAINKDKWAKYSNDEKTGFIKDQLIQADIARLGGGNLKTRKATSNDVQFYKQNGIELKEGENVWYTEGSKPSVTQKESPTGSGGSSEELKEQDIQDQINELAINPILALEATGEGQVKLNGQTVIVKSEDSAEEYDLTLKDDRDLYANRVKKNNAIFRDGKGANERFNKFKKALEEKYKPFADKRGPVASSNKSTSKSTVGEYLGNAQDDSSYFE